MCYPVQPIYQCKLLPMKPALNIAISAARAAGHILIRNAARSHALKAQQKGVNDFVTEVDIRAEQEIISIIHKAYPDHAIVAEESGRHEGKQCEWIIDPLDGTTNFMHGIPQYAVSIAMREGQKLQIGVIYDPFKEELFCASRGEGATLNNRKIRVSGQYELQGSLIGTGLPYRLDQEIDAYLATLRALIAHTSGIRRAGAAALDLAYVAAGRLDGFWEFGLKIWDVAAGVLLIQEAGGLVSDLDGGHDYMETGNIVAANNKLFKPLLTTLNTAAKNV